MLFLKSKHHYLLPIIPLLIFSNTVYSAGFALIENSASGMGNAFAGAAAVAEDSSTIWFNPAGMTYLGDNSDSQSQLSGVLHIVSAKTKFTDKGSSAPASLLSTIDGVKTANERVTSPVPNLYYMRKIKPRLHFGVAINAPFGSTTKYDENWVGRYQATETEMKTVNINPSLSWKANNKLSVAGGISAQYIHVSLGKALDSAAACRKVALAGGSSATLDACNTSYPQASQVAKDSQVVVEGEDISLGFNLGLLYQPTSRTRVGASYRSKVKHDLEGDISFDLDPTLKAIGKGLEAKGINTFKSRDIKAETNLPESISLSVAHKVNQKLELLGDVTWTGWSSFPELLITDADTGADVTRTPENWKDVTRVAIGANYKYSNKLVLRTGLALDEEPIPSAKFRTPRIPGNDRTWLSFGAGYKMSKKTNFDFGYSHLFLDETPIDNTDDAGYAVKGLYDSNVNIFSAQVNYNF
jgi:long-chain fatty acid transport protein